MPRAVVIKKLGEDIDAPGVACIEEIPETELDDSQVRVKVLSCGVVFPDLLKVAGKYQQKVDPPFVPGGDVCGEIIAVGESVVEYKVGDKVFGTIVADSDGLNGGMADTAVLDEFGLYRLPEGVSPHVAAGFEINYGTTYHGLVDIAALQEGETLLVLGASGGVGMAAIDIAKALGATVIACASSSAKLAACKEAGADIVINYTQGDFRKSIKQSLSDLGIDGVDVVYDPVGGQFAEPSMRSLAWGGRYLVVGFAAGGTTPASAIPKMPLNLALLSERKILGVFWGAWKMMDNNETNGQNIAKMMAMIQQGKLNPVVSHIFPLAEFKGAFQALAGRRVIGKIQVDPTKARAKL